MSTPTSLDMPAAVRRTTVHTPRGSFAALEAVPASGVAERDAALLVPGYTGSKEDFLAILDLLAGGSHHVVAVDMRGQFESPAAGDPDGYAPAALGADLRAIMQATGARHLIGHSYGGLIAREAVLGGAGPGQVTSLTLMSSGPAALPGPRAEDLRSMLAILGVTGASVPSTAALQAGIFELWRRHLELQAVEAGVPRHIVAFLARRMLGNDPTGLVLMARHLLSATDRTAELARLPRLPVLIVYGENDDAWPPAVQEAMARRLGARRLCIPAAAHSPAVDAPAATASALTRFWDSAEVTAAQPAAVTGTPSCGLSRPADPPTAAGG